MLRRAEIRKDVIDRLKGKTDAGARVFPSRKTPLEPGDIPAILVYTVTNSAEQPNPQIAPESLFFSNELSLVLELHATGDSDDLLDDALDAIADQVEQTLLGSISWVRQFPVIGPIETEISYDSESDKRRGLARITIGLQYATTFQPVTP